MSLPKENLDNKRFDELVKEAVSRIPIYAPDWTDHNIHDPGITFIELFAWLAEMQMYSLNKIPERNYRKFLKLMGIPRLNPASPAKVDVTFTLLGDDPLDVPHGTLVAARDPLSGEDILFETKDNLCVVDAELEKILSRAGDGKQVDRSDANENENVYYYAFSSQPKKGDKLEFGFSGSLSGKEITLAFYLFEEKKFTGTEEEIKLFTYVKLIWEYCNTNGKWITIEPTKDETRHLTVSGKIRIHVPSEVEMAKFQNDQEESLFWIRCEVVDAQYDIIPRIDRILLNTVSAIQCSDLKAKTFPSSGLPGCSIDLEHVPVLYKSLVVIVKEEINGVMRNVLWSKREDYEASRAVMDKLSELRKTNEIEDPGGSEPEDEHFIIDHGRVEDFDASKPGDRHFMVDLADGRVTFGDGLHGRIPPEGTITVYYQSGGGERGNVKPHTITRVVDDQLARRVEVDNIKPAAGGKEAESLDKAKQCARNDLKKVCRAVTTEDYEYLARNVPGVARVKPLPWYHPSHDDEVPGIVTIIVVPKNLNIDSEVKVSPGLIKTVYSYLEKKRLLATELFVIPPEFEKVSVIATVVIHPRNVTKKVEENVIERLNYFLNPTTGGTKGKGWDFGRPVYLSEIYEMIDHVDGVDYVTDVTINGNKGDKKIPKHTLVYSGDHDISAVELGAR